MVVIHNTYFIFSFVVSEKIYSKRWDVETRDTCFQKTVQTLNIYLENIRLWMALGMWANWKRTSFIQNSPKSMFTRRFVFMSKKSSDLPAQWQLLTSTMYISKATRYHISQSPLPATFMHISSNAFHRIYFIEMRVVCQSVVFVALILACEIAIMCILEKAIGTKERVLIIDVNFSITFATCLVCKRWARVLLAKITHFYKLLAAPVKWPLYQLTHKRWNTGSQ